MKSTSKAERERRERVRVFEIMGNGDIEPHILVGNMEVVLKWLRTGIVPRKPDDKKPTLKVV